MGRAPWVAIMGEVKKRLQLPWSPARPQAEGTGPTSMPTSCAARVPKNAELRSYFDYSSLGIVIEEDGLKEISFGEFLVEQAVLDRHQLLLALQMQDRQPGVRLGECAAALGFAPIGEIERQFSQYAGVGTVVLA